MNTKSIINWLFGILFIVIGIGLVFTDSKFISGIIMFVVATILIPPTAKFIETKLSLKISFLVKIIIGIIGFIIFISSINSDSNLADTESTPQKQVNESLKINDDINTDLAQTEEKTTEEKEELQNIFLTISAETVKNDEIKINGETNLPNGSILEIAIYRPIIYQWKVFDSSDPFSSIIGTNSNVKVIDGKYSSLIKINENKWFKDIDLVEKFKNDVETRVIFSLNNGVSPDIIQPKNVVEVVGQKGEYLKGDLATEYGTIETSIIFDYPPKTLEKNFALGDVMDYKRKVDEKTLNEYFQEKTSPIAVSNLGWEVKKNPQGDGYLVAYKFSVNGLTSVPIWLVQNSKIYWVNGKAHTYTEELPETDVISAGDAYDLFK